VVVTIRQVRCKDYAVSVLNRFTPLKTSGFTLVEILVIIVVIGILAGVVIVSYGAWEVKTAETSVQAELDAVKTSMADYRNFNNGYPTVIPTTFTPSEHVQLQYMNGDAQNYCIRGTSLRESSVVWYLMARGTETAVSKTAC
jgi:Tfp pilus assembly protein PilE